MKKSIITFSLLILLQVLAFCQIDANGNSIKSGTITKSRLKSGNVSTTIDSIDIRVDSVRALSELNSSNYADAYPWISSDGLRIYYTKSDGTSNYIYFASRKNVHQLFSNAYALPFTSFKTVLSCWLTSDELNIYFTDNSTFKLYHAQRSSIVNEFGTPTQVIIDSRVTGFISGPSFTPDLSQLFLFNDDNKNRNIFIFKKNGIDNYILSDTLSAPIDYIISAGALSPDELSFFLSFKNLENDRLYYYSRNSLSEKFTKLYYIKNALINNTITVMQPNISTNGNYFVYTINTDKYWNANDLYIGYLKPETNIPLTQTISLTKGWNLISFNVSPSVKTIENVFSPIMSNVVEIKNADGFWEKGQATVFNSLKTINDGEAYFVYVNADCSLDVTGLKTTLPLAITIKPGWNLMGVPSQGSLNIASLLGTKPIEYVKNFTGFWQPNGSLNTITTVDPGKGYFIKATTSTIVAY